MRSAIRPTGFTGRVALLAIVFLAAAFSPAQAHSPSAAEDTFSSIHENLTEAADRALAAALANQEWMKTSNIPATVGEHPSIAETNSILQLRTAIDRVNRLRPTLEPILRSEGVPVELSAVVLVESGGLAAALSPKGARGVWQFMPDTARRYGLVVDGVRDDRTDVVKSTHAAAHYLQDLYGKFGDWSLALAAYNAGEVAIRRAIHSNRSIDFRSVRDRGHLPLETRNYVPAISIAMNRLGYESSWFDSHGTNGRPSADIVYAFSGSAE
jgi:hypothetical protein